MLGSFKTISGEELTITSVSQVDIYPLILQVDSTRPLPPVIKFPDGTAAADENHPGYKSALAIHTTNRNTTIMAAYIEFGVSIDLDEEMQRTVDLLRAKRERVKPGAPENRYDTYTYVSFLCPNIDELNSLIDAITNLTKGKKPDVVEA